MNNNGINEKQLVIILNNALMYVRIWYSEGRAKKNNLFNAINKCYKGVQSKKENKYFFPHVHYSLVRLYYLLPWFFIRMSTKLTIYYFKSIIIKNLIRL